MRPLLYILCVPKAWGKDLKFSGWNHGLSRDYTYHHVPQNWMWHVKLAHIKQHHLAMPYKLQKFNILQSMSPYTTAVEKAIICTMKKLGSSHDDICAALADRHNITDWQILRIFRRYADKENYNEVGHSTGHPHKLTPCNTLTPHKLWYCQCYRALKHILPRGFCWNSQGGT